MSNSDVQKNHVLHSRNGRFGPNTDSQVGDASRILQSAQVADWPSGLVIHFHGGLNSEAVGREIADKLTPRYVEAGSYPLFFVWESGAWESVRNNLNDILADPAFRELVKKVAEWSLKKLGGQVGLKGGPGRTVNERELRKEFDAWFNGALPEPPVTDEGTVAPTAKVRSAAGLDVDDLAADIEAGLDDDPQFQDAIQKLHNTMPGATATTKGAGTTAVADKVLVDEDALKELFPGRTAATRGGLVWLTVAKYVATVVIRVIKRYAKGRAHGMYCTVVEEVLRAAYLDKVGAILWNQMKKDTADGFGADAECCGTAVIREIAALQTAGKSFKKITLVGHSTGALYICQFLDKVAEVLPDLKVDIVFLAPALRHDRFAAALSAHQQRIAGFRMFGMTDALESDDTMVPILYTRSLLYFVSGLLEGHVDGDTWEDDIDAPVVGMQRYISEGTIFNADDFPQIAGVAQFLANRTDAAVWSEAELGNGKNSKSHKHGDFDDDPDTLSSLVWIIKNGF